MTPAQGLIGVGQTSLITEFLVVCLVGWLVGWLVVVVLCVAPMACVLNFIFLSISEACVLCVLFIPPYPLSANQTQGPHSC